MLFQNPIVWLKRVRYRKGYGVHSPFAYDFVTGVIYNKEKYYAYSSLDSSLHWWQCGREKSLRHLAFRLSNYRCPQTMYCSEGLSRELVRACHDGSRGVVAVDGVTSGTVDMIFVDCADEKALKCLGEGTMMVVWNLRENMDYWQRIKDDGRVTVTFDLYDVGIAFARKDLNKQHYINNW